MSKRGTRRRRRRSWQRGAEGSAKAQLPFPYSLLTNIKLFYLVGILVMVVGLVAGVLVSFGGSSPHSARTSQTSRDSGSGDVVAETKLREEAPQFKTYERPPGMAIDPNKRYFATIETDKGPVRIELFAKEAPQTVNNFVFLARDGFYNGLTFHYVLKEFIAMAGDPACTPDSGACRGLDGPGYTLTLERSPLSHVPGALAMVSDGGASHGSQFYITYADLSQRLDGTDVVFGRVVEGMDVLRSLSDTNPRLSQPLPGDRIISITVEERPAG